ncbi:GNAT family acetyltransferase [Bacillus manliponensis]|uniref:GNAT family acetyltransferase n=1 Tax=Bacillus manliponensis TaxID=574376 RepID=A0A073JWP5_9BACI|nr:GNAT family N-acetyltransferase [Bacillus manliponensis]KEK18637.1 GNAT family acetyltransferase [Bacillus manliponensis]
MVILKEMTALQFESYIEDAIQSYARQKVAAGNWTSEEAMSKSKEEFQRLLPDGEKTENNYLFTIFAEDEEVGMIWISRIFDEVGFIYKIQIAEAFQGKGYGKAAMKEIEIVAKELGMKKIELHVFGHNKVAKHLYESLDYETTNIRMAKTIV